MPIHRDSHVAGRLAMRTKKSRCASRYQRVNCEVTAAARGMRGGAIIARECDALKSWRVGSHVCRKEIRASGKSKNRARKKRKEIGINDVAERRRPEQFAFTKLQSV
jgi:hypothetical protein